MTHTEPKPEMSGGGEAPAESAVAGPSSGVLHPDLALSLTDWIWEIDEDGLVMQSTGRIHDALMRSGKGVIGRSFFVWSDFQEGYRLRRVLDRIVSSPETVTCIEHRMERDDDGGIFLRSYVRSLVDGCGKVSGYAGASRVIEEHPPSSSTSSGSAGIPYARIVESMSEGILVENREQRFVFANPAASSLLGYGEETLSLDWSSIVEPGSLEAIHAVRKRTEETGQFEITLLHRDGRRIPVLMSGSPTHAQEGDGGRFWAFTDLSDFKRVEEDLQRHAEDIEMARSVEEENAVQLVNLVQELDEAKRRAEDASRLKGEFISLVSHELKTPLAVMKGSVMLCLDGVAGEISEMQTDLLTDALHNIDRLTRLITDLLDVSKIEAGKVKLRLETVDVVQIAERVRATFQRLASEKGVDLCVESKAAEAVLSADPDKVMQIFNNLVANAIRFTDEGGRVTMYVESEEACIRCRVVDTGAGIAEENLPRLFSKFEQFGGGKGSDDPGTGLGLFIVKGLTEIHGGTVWAESKLGEGSTFGFTLARDSVTKSRSEMGSDENDHEPATNIEAG